MFDQMWDAIRSMKQQNLLSKAAFASAFESYCEAGRVTEAFMTFDAMENFGVEPDVSIVNSLLRAVVDSGDQIDKALEFFEKIKAKFPPDGDTFAAVFQGLERTNDVAKAKTTFGEMVIRLGWNSKYMPAYDAFLTILIRGGHSGVSIKFLEVMKEKMCLPGMRFLSRAIEVLAKKNDSVNAIRFWDLMVVDGSLVPDLMLNNTMIGLLCSKNDISNAFCFLDEMSVYGAFPNSQTYNMIFECLVKNKKVHEAGNFFNEMLKNECPPMPSSCVKAIEMLFSQDDPEMALEIWNYMLENRVMPISDGANALLIGFCEIGRYSELKRSAIEMMDRRIEIYESTMGRVKSSCIKDGLPRAIYESLHKRWRAAGRSL